MNKRCIASEAPAGRRRMPQAPEWAWRRPVATVLLFVYGCLPLLPSYALAAPPPLPDRSPVQVASLKGNTPALSELPTCPSPLAGLTEPAAQEAPLGSARLAALPRHGDAPNLLPPSILPPPVGATASSHVTAMGRLPLAFIENKGQVDERARFYVRSGGQTVWLSHQGITFDLLRTKDGAATKLKIPIPDPRHPTPASPPQPQERERLVFAQDFVGAATQPTIEARNPLPGIYNFFIGKDPAKWRTEVKGYAELIYREVWDGIDLKLYGNGRALEQEFIVRRGGDLSRIKVAYRGIEGLTVAQDGSLLITTAFGTLKESPPRIYQEIDGKRVEVAGRFKLLGTTAYTFDVGPYHPQYALVIDPTLVYSTYLGGGGGDSGRGGIAVDASGNVFVTGVTDSADFPITTGAYDASYNGGNVDVLVTKFNSTGSTLVYSTFLGGNNDDWGHGIAVDASGNIFVTGYTHSSNFPTTPGAYDTTYNGGEEAFVTKLNPTGSALSYSTFLGGSDHDYGWGIAMDASGNAYVTGWTYSTDFPTTPGAYDTSSTGVYDAFVTKLDPSGSALSYSTFLGGGDTDRGYGIAIDASGNAYVTGTTDSTNFPTVTGAFGTSYNGGMDAFVTKLNPAGSGLVYSTFLGGSIGGSIGDAGNAIAVDASGNAYVSGGTYSSNFPTTLGAFDTSYNGGGHEDAFVTKLNPTGSALAYSTFLGGSDWDAALGIAVDASGNVYVTGWTRSVGFPTTLGAFDTSHNGGVDDAFVAKLNATGSALAYSTFLGGNNAEIGHGIAVDASGNVYVTGWTGSSDFPTTPGAYDTSYNAGGDAFVTKFSLGNSAPIANAGPDQTVNEGALVTLDGSGSSDSESAPLTYQWVQIAGPSVALDLTDPVHPTFVAPTVPAGGATFAFELTVNDGQLTSDPDVVNITVKNVNHPPVADAGIDQTVTEGAPVTLNGSASYDPDGEGLTYSWTQTVGPSVALANPAAAQPAFTAPLVGLAGETLSFLLTVSDGIDSAIDTVNVFVENVNHPPTTNAGADQTKNEGSVVTLNGLASTDPDGDPLVYNWTQLSGPVATLSDPSSPTPSFTAPLVNSGGDTLVFQLVVSDGLGGSATNEVAITILNINDPPACGLAQVSPALLWPPNHKLVPVGITGVSDPDNDQMTITVTGVTQDEAINGLGDGDTSPDAVIQGNSVLLRAERAGGGNGRVYEVTFSATDAFGGSCIGSVTICVPHDLRAAACVDNGQFYDSLQP